MSTFNDETLREMNRKGSCGEGTRGSELCHLRIAVRQYLGLRHEGDLGGG